MERLFVVAWDFVAKSATFEDESSRFRPGSHTQSYHLVLDALCLLMLKMVHDSRDTCLDSFAALETCSREFLAIFTKEPCENTVCIL